MNTPLAQRRGENASGVDCDNFAREAAETMRGPVAQLQALLVPMCAGHTVAKGPARLRSQLAAVSEAAARAQRILDGENEYDGDGS